MEKKGKIIETTSNLLPEPIIQHIQSFLNTKEAARTTLVSKPWYTAWLTRLSLDFDECNFQNLPPESCQFEEFTAKTMQRYQDLKLNIQSFRLRIHTCPPSRESYKLLALAHNLIVNAIKIGATDVELDLPSFVYPREVLECKSIVRLFLAGGEIDGDFLPCWPWLKSLSIDCVDIKSDDVFWNIITTCSIEDLSLCRINMKRQGNAYELHKLKCLFLDGVFVDNTFFSDFASKFPCLKDLSLVNCLGYTRIEMVSTSLEFIRLEQPEKRLMDKFDVPNIRKFAYSGGGIPSLSIRVSSTREWEFDISIKCDRFTTDNWFLSMKRLLKKMRLSTITVSFSLDCSLMRINHGEVTNNFGVLPKRAGVESLTFEAPSKFCSVILLPLLGFAAQSS